MKYRIKAVLLLPVMLVLACHVVAGQADPAVVNPEEARLVSAVAAMPHVLEAADRLDEWLAGVTAATSHEAARLAVMAAGLKLWNSAVARVQAGALDDRPLYWQRLYVNRALRNAEFRYPFSTAQRQALIELHETASRGQSSLVFKPAAEIARRIVVSGFDPFLLDRNLEQVNPSGVVALALDGRILDTRMGKVEVQAVMMPVRYADFDQGELERWLAPVYAEDLADLVVTVSMGREHFDLERFPGLRRSATAPGNLKVVTGANAENPLVPEFPSDYPPSAEFVEFSLPAEAMLEVSGAYQVNLNARVATLEAGEMVPTSLSELSGLTAVRGGGGGYLSNEISYRSINLRQHLNSTIPTGHIHTPRIADAAPGPIAAIVAQTQAMIVLAVEAQ